MDERGSTRDLSDVIDLVIIALFFMGMFWFVNSYFNGAAIWEDFYSKEISSIINSAKNGSEFKVDVTRLASIAIKNGKPLNEIIKIDNVNNQVIVSTRPGSGSSFGFFNDVDITDYRVENPSGGPESTRLIFKVRDRQR